MITKSVVEFGGKGVLLGVLLPSMLFASSADAHQRAAKKQTTASIVRPASPAKQGAASHTAFLRKARRSSRASSFRPQALATTTRPKHRRSRIWPSVALAIQKHTDRRQTPKQKPATVSLGAFTLRAYTQYGPLKKKPVKTATGTIPEAGRTVAVDPRIIPFGTRLYIEGLGERIAEDTGAKIKGKQIDVFLPSVTHCVRFGVQTQNVQALLE